MAAGVGDLLLDLPSSGRWRSLARGQVLVPPPSVYLANHDTTPSADQVIHTDPTSILVRQLQNRKARQEKRLRGTPGAKAADKGKRALDPSVESQRAVKRQASSEAGPSHAGPSDGAQACEASHAGQGGGSPSGSGAGVPPPEATKFSRLALQARTIRELQSILKTWGLPVSGKKDDLVTRILDAQQQAAAAQTS